MSTACQPRKSERGRERERENRRFLIKRKCKYIHALRLPFWFSAVENTYFTVVKHAAGRTARNGRMPITVFHLLARVYRKSITVLISHKRRVISIIPQRLSLSLSHCSRRLRVGRVKTTRGISARPHCAFDEWGDSGAGVG